MRTIDRKIADLDPLTRAVLMQAKQPKMTADDAEKIVRERLQNDPCDLSVGWQVMVARDACAPIISMPSMRLPGPVTREVHERNESLMSRFGGIVFAGLERILAARRAEVR